MSRSLDDLVREGLVLAPQVELGPRRSKHRRLFVSKCLERWRLQLLSTEPPKRTLQSERGEIDAIFAEFIAGRAMTHLVDARPPTGEGIRKIKTHRYRLWGWSAAPQTLVLLLAATKDQIAAKEVSEKRMSLAAHRIRKRWRCHEVTNGPWYELFRKA